LPNVTLFIFLCAANNIVAPRFNFLGDIILINGLVSWNHFIILILFVSF